MAISAKVRRVRENEDNIKKGHRYYRNKVNGYGKSIRLAHGIQCRVDSTKGDMYQQDTREFQGTKESSDNIEAFIASNGIKKYTTKGKFTILKSRS